MNTLALLLLCAAPIGANGGGDDPPKPELRLQAAVSVRSLDVKIGDLCEITPTNATTLAIAQMRFGPAPINGYSRKVTRTDLVQALAAGGVQMATIKLSGASEAIVQGIMIDVEPRDMVDAATAVLQAQLSVEGGDVEFEAPGNVRRVKAPPGRISQELKARVRNTRTGPNSAVVDVEILVDGDVFKKVPITFKLQRYHLILKTAGTIRKDTPLGPDNISVVREPMAQFTGMFLDKITQVTGMNAARNLQPNRRLTLGDLIPPAVIRKGDIVTVVLTRGRVKITARAMANHDAPLEGRITLTNINSRSTLTGVVHGPGLVVVPQ